MSRKLTLALFLALAAFRAQSATHVWLGTASNRISTAENWSGGSPVGDDVPQPPRRRAR